MNIKEYEQLNNINRNEVFKCLKNSYSLVYHYNKYYILINIIISAIQGVIPSVLIVIMQKIINSLQIGEQFDIVLIYIAFYIFISLFESIIANTITYYNIKFNLKFSKYVNIKMLKKSSDLKLSDFEDKNTYDMINRANSQNGASILSYIMENINLFKEIITLLSTSIIIVNFKWWIVFIILFSPVLECIITIKLNTIWYKIRINRTSKERKAWYINFLFTTGNAFKEIKVFGLKKYLINKFEKIQTSIISQDILMHKKEFILGNILDIIDNSLSSIIYFYTIYQGYIRKILIGDVTAYIDCVLNIKNNMKSIFSSIENIIAQSMYINLLFNFLNIECLNNNEEDKIKIDKINKIEFKNVSFSYDAKVYTLKNINLTINLGDRVALIGENGSGKTTITKLILGLYDNYDGEILINDIELKKINKKNYYSKIGCIFQDYIKYETNIMENIGFGDIDNICNKDKILETLKSINFDCNICNSLEDLDIIIGNWFGCRQLSLGQWQKLAVARAIFKDADIYVLDEPDSSLDIFKQYELIDIYKKIMNQSIGIYVTHKVNYVPLLASHIYIIEDGCIVEQGTHENLLKSSRLYKNFFNKCNNL